MLVFCWDTRVINFIWASLNHILQLGSSVFNHHFSPLPAWPPVAWSGGSQCVPPSYAQNGWQYKIIHLNHSLLDQSHPNPCCNSSTLESKCLTDTSRDKKKTNRYIRDFESTYSRIKIKRLKYYGNVMSSSLETTSRTLSNINFKKGLDRLNEGWWMNSLYMIEILNKERASRGA